MQKVGKKDPYSHHGGNAENLKKTDLTNEPTNELLNR